MSIAISPIILVPNFREVQNTNIALTRFMYELGPGNFFWHGFSGQSLVSSVVPFIDGLCARLSLVLGYFMLFPDMLGLSIS